MLKMLMFDIKESEKAFVQNYDTRDFEITFFKESLNKTTKLTLKECDETVILSVFLTSEVTKEVLDKFKNLRIVVTRSICYNHIDLDECRNRNIAVINATDYGKKSVSQYVLGLIFALTRNIFLSANNVRCGVNNYEKYLSDNIETFSLGVVGTGSIGAEVCKLAHSLGMKIYANDISVNQEVAEFVQYVSFTDLLRKSDIITLHIPYTKELKHMFSYKEFEIMKENSYLINTSQGDFINYADLYQALLKKKLKGVALDIIPEDQKKIFGEKINYDELEKAVIYQKLTETDNVIITPRIAYDTKEALNKIIKSNFNDIKDYYKGRKTNRVV